MSDIPDSMGDELAEMLGAVSSWETTIAKAAALDGLFAIKVLELRGCSEETIAPWVTEHLKLRQLTDRQYEAAVNLIRFVITGDAADLDACDAMIREGPGD